jgi:putative transposase
MGSRNGGMGVHVSNMGRKLRLEFPGACYHVINRGNYRRDVFATEGAKAAFESCVFEACEKSEWLLHAFVVMRNHYHLAIETPAGNLVVGMQWLQATFANRFNRRRGERGHLFQGRYKALLVEEGDPLGLVSHYIHLNPLRAGIVSIDRLGEYRYSSYWYLRRPQARPPWLRLDLVLAATGGLTDTESGWNSYRSYLAWQAEQGPVGKSQAYASLSKGWALGSTGFKSTLLQDHAVAALSRAWEKDGAREIRFQRWELLLRLALSALGRSEHDLVTQPKTQIWKVALALFLKQRSQATNRWLARRLRLGGTKYVSHLISVMRRAPKQPPAELLLLLKLPITPATDRE